MQITGFKNLDEVIIKKEEYLGLEVPRKELALFDKGFLPVNFNIGLNDVMEFVMYDVSNNVLPQLNYGSVRYIKKDQIRNYLIRSENINDKTIQGGGFLIDTKKLIREAGYGAGYYRVQLNFVNNRVGSDYPKDRLWIEEISPSRTEVRLLPYDNFDPQNRLETDIKRDLEQSYDSFTEGKFSADEVYAEIDALLDQITPAEVDEMLSTIYPAPVIQQIENEFSLKGGMEEFYRKVLISMKESVRYTLLYRNATLGDANYGLPIVQTNRQFVSYMNYYYYNKADIIDLLNRKFKESVQYHLPKRDLLKTPTSNAETVQSLDELNTLVRALTSTTEYGLPEVKREIITPPPPPPPPPPSPVIPPPIVVTPQVESTSPSAPKPTTVPPPPPPPPYKLTLTGSPGTFQTTSKSAWQLPQSQIKVKRTSPNTISSTGFRTQNVVQLRIRTENDNKVSYIQGTGLNFYNLDETQSQKFTLEVMGKAKNWIEVPTSLTIPARKGTTPGKGYATFKWKPYKLDRTASRNTVFEGMIKVTTSLGDTYFIGCDYDREVSRADTWGSKGEAKVFIGKLLN